MAWAFAGISDRNMRPNTKRKIGKGSLPSFVIGCAAAYSLRRITAYSAASIPSLTNTAVNPGAPFFAVPAVVPSAAGLFVGDGVTRSPGGASVAASVADAAGVFVAVTAGAGGDSLSSLSSSRVLRQTRIPRSCPALPH